MIEGEQQDAGPLRRLGAMLYDALLVLALMFFTTLFFLPFNGGAAPILGSPLLRNVYRLALVLVVVFFFGRFWTTKGRTLGMQAWRIAIVRVDGGKVSWRDALARLAAGLLPWLPGLIVLMFAVQPNAPKFLLPLGTALLSLFLINYCVAWFDPSRRSWHERRLGTRIVIRK